MKMTPSALLTVSLLLSGSAASASPKAEKTALTRAIAAALVDAGARVVTNVPATGVTEVFDAFCDLSGQPKTYSYNEEVAYTVAHGAAIGGVRSAAVLKSHGFAKAANSVIDSLTAGNTAGFVVLVFNDESGEHSDTDFDTLPFVRGTKLPVVVPKPGAAYEDVLQAFRTSERLRVPVAVVLDSNDLAKEVSVARRRLPAPAAAYRRDVYQYLLFPLLAPYQQKMLEARLAGKPLTGEKPRLPIIPDQLSPQFQATARSYVPVFEAFKKVKGADAVTAGDTGTSTAFAFPPFDCIDMATYYGGSIPLAIGLYLSGKTNAWAVTGDYAFVAAGHMGLIEAVQRGIPLKVLILHNGFAAATGGQRIMPDVFERLLSGYKDHIRYIKHAEADADAARKVLAEAKASGRLEIIVAEVP
ncbi:MAG: thiamine pyrophosphate-dependent enzyme [Elusimicrobia bacterium]|nr:thiamine pyrophosphate-dependent enzyme [Elusimicrobiota bacterium]